MLSKVRYEWKWKSIVQLRTQVALSVLKPAPLQMSMRPLTRQTATHRRRRTHLRPQRVEEPSTGLGPRVLPEMSSGPPSVAVSTNTVDSSSDSCVTNPMVRISGITEIGRDGKTSKIVTWKPPFEVQKGCEASFAEICERAESVRFPVDAVPVPTGSTPYGTTDELFDRLQKAIAAQARLPERASRLLAYWVISTWFPDGLSLAPGLAILGPSYEGDLVLRTLRNFCRNPLLLTGITAADLRKINWRIPPTLLCFEPNLTKQMAAILGSAAARGYMAGGAGTYLDFYCSRAFYIGDEVSVDRVPRCSVQVNLLPTVTPACATQGDSRLTEMEVQNLQNQLLDYRLKNLVRVHNSKFDASQIDIRHSCCRERTGRLHRRLRRDCNQTSFRCSRRLRASVNQTARLGSRLSHWKRLSTCATRVNRNFLPARLRLKSIASKRRVANASPIAQKTSAILLKKVGLYTRRLGKARQGPGRWIWPR